MPDIGSWEGFPFSASAQVRNGVARLWLVLPVPPDKNDRLAPNCIASEKGGRLYFKAREGLWKLSPAARKYQANLHALLDHVLPRRPWFIKGQRWELHVDAYDPGDVDHYLPGLLDDLCSGGLAKGDKDCKRRVANAHEPDDGPLRVEVVAIQEQP